MIVLDTNVLSEPLRPSPAPAVVAWLDAQAPETLYLTTICLAELLAGIEVLPRGKRRTALGEALTQQLLSLFGDRVLSFDTAAAQAFAQVYATAAKQGRPIGFADCAIASIAKANRCTLATRNVRDFSATGVEVVDPWSHAPHPK